MMVQRRRSRRRKGWSTKLRHFLLEHRFNAAQGLLGVLALTAGLWLLWPSAQSGTVDHRGRWQRSLQPAKESFAGRDDAVRDGLVAVTESSLAVSAKGQLVGSAEPWVEYDPGPRLAKIAETMPAIGVPDSSASAPGSVQLPENVVGLPSHTVLTAAELGATVKAMRAATANATVAQLLPHGVPDSLAQGTPTWLRNAVATPLSDGRAAIAVVIDDLGLNRRGTAALNTLKAPLTLSFLPYAGALEQQTRAARAAGHELMLHVPMEPAGAEWPGPNALLSSLTPADLVSRLRSQLRSFRGLVGINNHMGSLLTADRAEMAVVMAELRARGLLFVDSRTTSNSVAASEAQRMGVAHTRRDVFLDNDIDAAAIRRQLATVEQIARRRGVAVAIGHPHDVTIEALREWLPTLEQRGFALVPISTVVARESCASGLVRLASACGQFVAAQNTIEWIGRRP